VKSLFLNRARPVRRFLNGPNEDDRCRARGRAKTTQELENFEPML
jgi:hypothetical protein